MFFCLLPAVNRGGCTAQTDKYHLIITSLFTSTAQLGSWTNIAVRAGLSLGITRAKGKCILASQFVSLVQFGWISMLLYVSNYLFIIMWRKLCSRSLARLEQKTPNEHFKASKLVSFSTILRSWEQQITRYYKSNTGNAQRNTRPIHSINCR